MTIRLAERAFSWLRQLLRLVHHVDRSLLELHRVASGGRRDADQPLRQCDVAVVIDTNLGDHVARLPVANVTVPDSHYRHLSSLVRSERERHELPHATLLSDESRLRVQPSVRA